MDGAMIIGRVTTVTLRGAQTPPIRPKPPGSPPGVQPNDVHPPGP